MRQSYELHPGDCRPLTHPVTGLFQGVHDRPPFGIARLVHVPEEPVFQQQLRLFPCHLRAVPVVPDGLEDCAGIRTPLFQQAPEIRRYLPHVPLLLPLPAAEQPLTQPLRQSHAVRFQKG